MAIVNGILVRIQDVALLKEQRAVNNSVAGHVPRFVGGRVRASDKVVAHKIGADFSDPHAVCRQTTPVKDDVIHEVQIERSPIFFGLLWGAWLVGAGVVTKVIMWRNPVDVPADSPLQRTEPRRRVIDMHARFDLAERDQAAAASPPRFVF